MNRRTGQSAHRLTMAARSEGEAVRKAALVRRLARIEGQVRGLRRLVDEDAYCVDVLIQISAVRAALQAVGLSILDRHLRTCVTSAIKSEPAQADASIKELIDVLKRFTK
ncbi:MAG TPA: metal-sensitive transcriptional regulator [Firmicutes bacterium]|nr:metal-sensitive transcriptional regulator [Bacillota bacterium]